MNILCTLCTYTFHIAGALQCVHTSVKMAKKKDTGLGVIHVSFILQLSTIALAILLLLAGDVERNPGPPPSKMGVLYTKFPCWNLDRLLDAYRHVS